MAPLDTINARQGRFSAPSLQPSSYLKHRAQKRRKVKICIIFSFVAASLLLATVLSAFQFLTRSGDELDGDDIDVMSLNSRHLLSTDVQNDSSSQPEDAKLPWEACHLEKNSDHTYLWLLLWALIVFWLFIALAMICDDFFVPSLEEISDRLNLTEDVAGATFMAAGSSAPELFTSLSGVFVKSDVGIGTIVGSAIFNLLIIIALSAALAGKVLSIDWRPLTRDALFYSLSIICFITFCWDAQITVIEASALFALYIVYVSLMFFNPRLMNYMNAISCCCTKVVPQNNAAVEDNVSKSDEQDHRFRHTAQLNGLIRKMSIASSTSQSVRYNKPTNAPLAIEEVSEIFEEKNSPYSTEHDPTGVDFEARGETSPFGHHTEGKGCTAAEDNWSGGLGAGSEIVFSGGSLNNWYYAATPTPSTARYRNDSVNCSQGTRKSSNTSLGHVDVPNNEQTAETNNDDGGGEDDDSDEIVILSCMPGVPMAFPHKSDNGLIPFLKFAGSWALFVLAFPWALAFAWTVPNCGKPHLKKYYLLSFFLSLSWIGACSFAMVLLVGRAGCALDIQQFVMGLVIVAVGTSVPDALSSVIVARDGYGDMAVSNAIGSNVFDIDLGLGLPFLVRMLFIDKLNPIQLLSADEKAAQKRHNNPVIPHVKFGFILFFILVLCYLVFIAVRFRLNKFVGITFVIMYVLFIAYALFQEFACDEGFAC